MPHHTFRDPNAPERRVLVVDTKIIYVRELARPTPETITQSAREIRNLSRDWTRFSIMVEFESKVIPGSAVLHRVSEEVLPLKSKLDQVAVVTQANVFLKVAIKFIAKLSGFQNISIHETREAALEHIKVKQELPIANG